MKSLQDVKKQVSEAKEKGIDVSELNRKLEKLLEEEKEMKKKEEEIRTKERVNNFLFFKLNLHLQDILIEFSCFQVTPWNVDTISNPGFTKTVINKPAARQSEKLSDEEREKRMKVFIKENEKLLKEYGMLRKYDDSKRFLQEHPQLVCEDTANYLVMWCINLELEDVRTVLCKNT